MSLKWIAVIMAWAAGASAMVGTAMAWGTQGRGTTLALGSVLAVALLGSTATIAHTEHYESSKDDDG
jgi:hypothetical protein